MTEQEIIVSSETPLAGTLTVPESENNIHPAVLLIAGSGKVDRNGNAKQLEMNVYKDLANFLTKQGLMTLRYDKRGVGKSGGDYMKAGLSDFITDAGSLLSFLKNHPKVDSDRVFILGHSEGALIAPAVHQKVPASGLILLAGAAEPSIDLLPRQNEQAFEELNRLQGLKGWFIRKFNITDKSRKTNEKIFNKVAASDQPVMRVKGIKLNAKWLRETLEYNVVDYLQTVTCPVLAVTGEKDVQVPPEHARKIAESVQGEAEWHIIPNMNHILRQYEGEHTMLGILKEYQSIIDEPLDADLLKIIKHWVRRRSGN